MRYSDFSHISTLISLLFKYHVGENIRKIKLKNKKDKPINCVLVAPTSLFIA